MATDRLARAWGSRDLNTLFPDGASTTAGVFPRAGERKSRHPYDKDLVEAAVRAGGPTRPVDPRTVHNVQGGLTRAGVSHYMESDEVYADKHQAGNQKPVVYNREGKDILLSGNHRAAAHLLQGKQFDAIYVEGGWGHER